MSSPDRPLEEVAAELRNALSLVYRRMKQTRLEAGLTLPESSALSRLEHNGPMTAAQLARLEQVSPQSIGATLRPLETSGLVARASDPDDGRHVILSLTEAGRATVHGKRAVRTEQLTQALTALSAEERAALLAAVPVLERLAREL
jgi:DNA-binding MarR family transcriptional regulator